MCFSHIVGNVREYRDTVLERLRTLTEAMAAKGSDMSPGCTP